MIGWYIEWIMLASVVILMVKVADFENQSPVLWGIASFFITLGCMAAIPYGFLGIMAGAVASYFAMFMYKVMRAEP